MKLVYLDPALDDLNWVRTYYERVFPEGAETASKHFSETEELLKAFPHAGRPITGVENRERRVSNTPFNLVYRIREDRIEVVRVRDTRSG